MNGFVHDIKALLQKYPWLSETLKGAIFIVGGLVSGIAIVDSRIEKAVNDRVEPYSELLNGMVVINHGRPGDKPAMLFRGLIERKVQERLRPESREMLYDNFLWAATEAPDPTQYSLEVRRFEGEINKSIAENSWRRYELGWYCLYTRDLTTAARYFDRAADLALLAGDENDACDAAQGKVCVALARGDSEAALKAATEYAAPLRDSSQPATSAKALGAADRERMQASLPIDQTTKKLARLYGPRFMATLKYVNDEINPKPPHGVDEPSAKVTGEVAEAEKPQE